MNGEDLIQNFREASSNAYEYSQKHGKPLSMTPTGKDIEVTQFFDTVDIALNICMLINRNIKGLNYVNKKFSVGKFLRKAKTIKKSKLIVNKSEEILREDILIDDYERRDSEIDYLKNLYHCLETISVLIKKSRRVHRRKSSYFPEYCAFCWRLINKNMILNYSESADYSAYYCLIHHPKKSDANYHKARTSLISALKNISALNDEYISRYLNKDLNPRFFYKATARFSKKHKPRDKNNQIADADDWKNSINYILTTTNNNYPYASKAINQIDLNKVNSWKGWFYSVINALDPTGQDSSSWDDANEKWNQASDYETVQSPYTGETVLLNILHRYEATCQIKAMPQPRGPKSGQVKKNNKLRLEIKKIAEQQLISKNKINAQEIARKLGLTRQRINVLLKELGLR